MGTDRLRDAAQLIDPHAVAIYLQVPRSQVILLQAYFELYDGVGTVRTLQGPGPIVCVLTTPEQLDACIKVLEAVHEEVNWEICTNIPADPL